MGKCITIYTDASFHYQTKTGGWGCWIKAGPGESSTHAGQFKNPVKTSGEAEMMALCNGIAAAKKLYHLGGEIFVVVTDCQAVIDYIDLASKHETNPHRTTRKGNKSPRQHCPVLFMLAKTAWGMLPMGCQLRVNKVKAHTGRKDPRSYINRVVDRAAKAKARQQPSRKGTTNASSTPTK